MNQLKAAVVGAGFIGPVHVEALRRLGITVTGILGCDDAESQRAMSSLGLPRAYASLDELLADKTVDAVHLAVPNVLHYEYSKKALAAGKHVYTEKPLAVTREDGQRVVAAAREAGLRLGCAPGTFLGGGLQTCRKLIDDGVIGRPVACAAFMMSHGHEHWHPDPAYYYQTGAGPMFDMGPYYLTALTTLLGPVARVAGSAGIQIPERTITSKPKYGEKIVVNTPDHVAGTLDFACGAIGTIITTFATWRSQLPRIEIYGTEGTLCVPDPNTLGGPVRLCGSADQEWADVPLTHGHADGRNMWGIGVADMAHAIAAGRPHRATGDQAYHVLDLMQAFLDSATAGRHVEIASTFQRPAPLPLGLPEDALDD